MYLLIKLSRNISSQNKILYNFCVNNPEKILSPEKKDEIINENKFKYFYEKRFDPDHIAKKNKYLKFAAEKSKKINAIVLSEKKKTEERDSKKLRDAILFEDILNSDSKIIIYDCGQFIYKRMVFTTIAGILIFGIGNFLLHQNEMLNKSSDDIAVFCGIGITIMLIIRFRKFQKYHVDKIIYDSNTKSLSIYTKNIIGKTVETTVHKNNLLHTYDPALNSKEINYINVETLDLYKIGYNYAWKEKELFAYLIGQRIVS